ncbi:colicin immunity protein [Methylomonas sp. UP202]|uniref:colicin immunity protein n=1 Tax=Methylomonas sp. UP202 TaxID=3040943 RepID=UPI00143B3EE7|nr:colicin immunity protein [Methylomonas sp. UP202]NJA06625.1 colicin immunity protein [Methylococcaceae bacterium WWC4]WGS86888.1 colicin immunity protein [Methylomonas sp. UP202]
MKGTRGQIYNSSSDFFQLEGSAVMLLTSAAAQSVCFEASGHSLVVVRVEGGIWRNPGFEARLDCIWDGRDPPLSQIEATSNNLRASDMIREESGVHDVFIITTAPLSGYRHN